MLDKIFDFLLKEHTEFMQETYLNSCNADFRKHPDSYIKACILFEQYALQPISIDFNKKGIMVTGSTMIRDFETRTNYAPIEVFYKIIGGTASITKLIMAYNIIATGRKVFSIENDILVIKGNINHWIDIKGIEKLEFNDVIASSIDGGEEKIKDLVNELNQRIAIYNKMLFSNSCIICSN